MINLAEFKTKIENNTLDTTFYIFQYRDSDFIFHQYLEKYKQDNSLQAKFIDSLNELSNTNNIFNLSSDIINIYEVETLDELIPEIDNLWIKCKKLSKDVQSEYDNHIIQLPKLEDWQIIDFIKTKGSGIPSKDLDYFISIYKNNIYRADQELDKIILFDESQRPFMYKQLADQLYTDESEYTIFNIVNSIVRRDTDAMLNYYQEIQNIDVEPYGLLKLLIDNFKHVIDIQLARNPSAESVGVNAKQFWAIQKFSCNHYTKAELIEIYLMLTKIDEMIKTGYIDTDKIVDYMICKIMLV